MDGSMSAAGAEFVTTFQAGLVTNLICSAKMVRTLSKDKEAVK